jgi:hypothetical protein
MNPAGAPIGTSHPAVQLQDSVIAGDVTIHQADANEIARVVHETGRCPACGASNTTPYSCESTNCETIFCFTCMQQYIHGHAILDYKLCKVHHQSELMCQPIDYEFAEWEENVKYQLHSLQSSKNLLESAPKIRPIGAIVGVALAIVGIFSEPAMIGLGAIIAIGSLLMPKIVQSNIDTAQKKLNVLRNQMPNTNPPERPMIAGRNMPNFTENEVWEFIYRPGQ